MRSLVTNVLPWAQLTLLLVLISASGWDIRIFMVTHWVTGITEVWFWSYVIAAQIVCLFALFSSKLRVIGVLIAAPLVGVVLARLATFLWIGVLAGVSLQWAGIVVICCLLLASMYWRAIGLGFPYRQVGVAMLFAGCSMLGIAYFLADSIIVDDRPSVEVPSGASAKPMSGALS